MLGSNLTFVATLMPKKTTRKQLVSAPALLAMPAGTHHEWQVTRAMQYMYKHAACVRGTDSMFFYPLELSQLKMPGVHIRGSRNGGWCVFFPPVHEQEEPAFGAICLDVPEGMQPPQLWPPQVLLSCVHVCVCLCVFRSRPACEHQ